MFEITSNPIGRFAAHRLINTITNEYLEVLTGFGAGINDLVTQDAQGELVSILDGYRTEKEIRELHHSKFKGSKLSPFPNRITDAKYTFEGASHQMPINDVGGSTNLHAFLHNRPFSVVDTVNGDQEAKLTLGYEYLGVEQGFSYTYQLTIEIAFGEQGITFATQIKNTDDQNIPIADGWHPYFNFDGGLSSVQMQFGAATRLSSNFGNPLDAIHGFESGALLSDGIELDDCFEVANSDENYEIVLTDQTSGVTVIVWQESEKGKYKYFQIYMPPSRKQIAIEPVSCPPNSLNTGDGLVVLAPGEVTNMTFGIKLKS
ncbi:MAG: hypothetical protein OCD76_08045 [Reichenbachiella sp.]